MQNFFNTEISTPNETGIVDLSEVTNNPTYVILTSFRLTLEENFELFIS